MAELISQHDDPPGEARHKVLEAFAALMTVGEAATKWAAVGSQLRADSADHEARATATRHKAQWAAERELIGRASNDTWLNQAGFVEVAQVWRTAIVHAASGNRKARNA